MRSINTILFLGLLFSFPKAEAQTANANQVYLEFFGAGAGASLNFDSRLGNKENGLGYRVGLGGQASYSSVLGNSQALAIPVGLNYLFGANKHHLEIGSGATVFFGNKNYDPQNFWGVNMNVGYRLTPFEKRGFSFRAGYMQWILFQDGTGFLPYLYLSFGYRF